MQIFTSNDTKKWSEEVSFTSVYNNLLEIIFV